MFCACGHVRGVAMPLVSASKSHTKWDSGHVRQIAESGGDHTSKQSKLQVGSHTTIQKDGPYAASTISTYSRGTRHKLVEAEQTRCHGDGRTQQFGKYLSADTHTRAHANEMAMGGCMGSGHPCPARTSVVYPTGLTRMIPPRYGGVVMPSCLYGSNTAMAAETVAWSAHTIQDST